MKKVLLLLFIMLLTAGCDELMEKFVQIHYFIIFRNYSNQTVYFYAEYILPDTLPSTNRPRWIKEVASGKKKEFSDYDVNDREFKRMKNERLTLFVLDKRVVDTYDWEYIRENNMILKRYEFFSHEVGLYVTFQ